jgi:hypothetical protein
MSGHGPFDYLRLQNLSHDFAGPTVKQNHSNSDRALQPIERCLLRTGSAGRRALLSADLARVEGAT